MRVLLDATAIPKDRGGVGRYLDGLIPALGRLDCLELVVVCQQRDVELYQQAGVEVVAGPAEVCGRARRLLWEQLSLPALCRQVGAQVLHSPHYTMPMRARVPTVVTLHDATFFSDPSLHLGLKRWFFRTATRLAVYRAAQLIVPSAATRTELMRRVSRRADRAVVAQHGVDSSMFFPPAAAEVAAVRCALGLGDEPYVAFLGTIEPRKNVGALIRGWVQACEARPDPPALVLAGGKGWDETIDDIAAQVPANLRLIRPGYRPLSELHAFLGGAEVVAYPALGEGFGLPVLEAMACGAAVLTTSRLALPEVGGDAVLYTDVDADSIAAQLLTLLDDPELRATLAARALARSAGFSWESSARVHAGVYAEAVG